MREPAGAWSTLVSDVRWSAGACLAAPLVPGLCVTTLLVSLVGETSLVGVLLFPLVLVVAAWLRAVPSSRAGPSWLDGRPSPSGVAR